MSWWRHSRDRTYVKADSRTLVVVDRLERVAEQMERLATEMETRLRIRQEVQEGERNAES
jgi:hypothetical protein